MSNNKNTGKINKYVSCYKEDSSIKKGPPLVPDILKVASRFNKMKVHRELMERLHDL